MSSIENVSRRRFLTGGIIGAGALACCRCAVLSQTFSPVKNFHGMETRTMPALHPSVFLGIDPDGTVWIVASRSEMGDW